MNVYIIEAERQGVYKIGITSMQPEDRRRTLQTASPFPLRVLHAVRCEAPARLERSLHKHFAERNTCGEWFALTHEEVEEAKRLCDEYAAAHPFGRDVRHVPNLSDWPETVFLTHVYEDGELVGGHRRTLRYEYREGPQDRTLPAYTLFTDGAGKVVGGIYLVQTVEGGTVTVRGPSVEALEWVPEEEVPA